jgi:6-pyruvoyltetrahydropterin/6-carboxytetrahydropterin synthase
MPEFHIRVAGDDLVFSAGHFITLQDGTCERLHGHTYHVAVDVFGPLDECQCVADFCAVRNAMKEILSTLDHRMLLPTQNAAIRVSTKAIEIEATFAGRRWLFPEDDCRLLPIANTTNEALAEYVGEQLLGAVKLCGGVLPDRVRVEIDEGAGCAAICDLVGYAA